MTDGRWQSDPLSVSTLRYYGIKSVDPVMSNSIPIRSCAQRLPFPLAGKVGTMPQGARTLSNILKEITQTGVDRETIEVRAILAPVGRRSVALPPRVFLFPANRHRALKCAKT
ncbi:hypothetical protein M0534_13190 [Methylonatrum kenyense]|uniref:hypothetical protein n=1 Tax=Methylonatrum kenyense TaxID=455253 RepID=UPI0020C04586|nr:hypothetical protein [Methylonatrum kenyense]MCK8517269.1 hypothetical protein [Methylonatrum kenyense]